MKKNFCFYLENNNIFLLAHLLSYFVKNEKKVLVINFLNDKDLLKMFNKIKVIYSKIFFEYEINNFLKVISLRNKPNIEDIEKRLLKIGQNYEYVFVFTNENEEVAKIRNIITDFILVCDSSTDVNWIIKQSLNTFNNLKSNNPSIIYSYVVLFNYDNEKNECLRSMSQCKMVFEKVKFFLTIPFNYFDSNINFEFPIDNFWLPYSIYLENLYKLLIN